MEFLIDIGDSLAPLKIFKAARKIDDENSRKRVKENIALQCEGLCAFGGNERAKLDRARSARSKWQDRVIGVLV